MKSRPNEEGFGSYPSPWMGEGREMVKKAKPPREVITHSEEETFRLAKTLARRFKGKEVVLLSGELGAGKTIFAKGIAAGLGMKKHHLVCSPSFTIMNVYEVRFPIYHFDLYRLEKSPDILDLGWEDYLDRGVVIVEWGERIPFALNAIRVNIRKGSGDMREIEISMTPSVGPAFPGQ
jgi:tRNA threonylcarbamoyladenosine biosynthesis protein TsaE